MKIFRASSTYFGAVAGGITFIVVSGDFRLLSILAVCLGTALGVLISRRIRNRRGGEARGSGVHVIVNDPNRVTIDRSDPATTVVTVRRG